MKKKLAPKVCKNYKDLFNNMPVGVAVYEPYQNGKDFIFLDFNKAAEKIDKLKKKDLIGKKVTKVFPGVKKMGLLDIFKKVYKTGKSQHHPISMYEDNALMGWRENFIFRTSDNKIVAVYSDETEAKKRELELEESKDQFNRVFLLSDYMVCVADLKTGYFTKVSPAFTEHLGWSEKEFLTKPILNFIHPDDVKKTADAIKEQEREGKEIIRFQNRYKKKGGGFRVLEWSVHPVPEEGVTYSSAYDITEKKETEKKLKKQVVKTKKIFDKKILPILQRVSTGDFSKNIQIPKEEDEFTELLVALRLMIEDIKSLNNEMDKKIKRKTKELEEKQDQLASMFDGMEEIIYVSDPKTYEILYMNGAAKKNWGDGIGKKCHKVLQNSNQPCSFCTNKNILGKNLGKVFVWEFQNSINKRWYRCTDKAIKWSNRGWVRFELATDITELKNIEDGLKSKNQDLEKINKLMVGRELKMIELKEKIKELENKFK